jgi:hypothetical protein
MYGVSWEDAANYDVVLNLAQMNIENASTMLMNMAQLPDFQMTPASQRRTEDLRIAAKARVMLARDERTHRASVKVRADNGVINVTYLPQDAKVAGAIPDVCRDLPGLKEIRTTMATTNLLWIQEKYEPHSEVFHQVVEIATKWNAAVELIRVAPEGEKQAVVEAVPAQAARQGANPASPEYNGGIEEDVPDSFDDNGGLKETLDELAGIGRSGGGRVVYGDPHQLVGTLSRTIPYTLVVIGDMFLSKGHAARQRETRDFRGYLSEHIKAPVVIAEELGTRYLFGKRDILRTAAFVALSLTIYLLVFTNEELVLGFTANAGWYADAVKDTFLARAAWMPKLVVSIAVFLLVPIVAYSYGTVAGALLKLIKME